MNYPTKISDSNGVTYSEGSVKCYNVWNGHITKSTRKQFIVGEQFPTELPRKFSVWQFQTEKEFYSLVSKGGRVIHAKAVKNDKYGLTAEQVAEIVSGALTIPHTTVNRKGIVESVTNYADLKQRLAVV